MADDDEKTVTEKLAEEFETVTGAGDPPSQWYTNLLGVAHMRTAREIIDGVDQARESLHTAADDGNLDRAIANKINPDMSKKEAREFTATAAQRSEHVDELVAEAAAMAHAKADVISSMITNINNNHISSGHS